MESVGAQDCLKVTCQGTRCLLFSDSSVPLFSKTWVNKGNYRPDPVIEYVSFFIFFREGKGGGRGVFGQDPKEHKEISQMHYKILLLWTKLFAAADIKIRKTRPILTFEGL